MGKSRRRIRSLADSGRFASDNGGGSGASRGSASSTSSSRGGAKRGRNRGVGGGGGTGPPESAPRSGSSLADAARHGGGGEVTTAGVVKRGGNLRWISPTNVPSSSGGAAEVKRTLYLQLCETYRLDGSITGVECRTHSTTILACTENLSCARIARFESSA